jgi:hypothetical protein
MPRNARTALGNKELRLGSRQVARHLLLTRGLIPTVLKERHAFTFNSRLDAAKVPPPSPNTNAHTLTSQHGSHRQRRRNDATELCSC